MKEVHIEKNDEKELPVPTAWRPIFTKIVDAFVKQDYLLADGVENVDKVSIDTAEQVKEYIEDYGERLVPLPEATWETSVYIWYGNHWEVLVDLWTEEEGRSDLVLNADVREKNRSYTVKINLVYVP